MIESILQIKETVDQNIVLQSFVQTEILTEINYRGESYPILSFTIGPKRGDAPVLFLTGGIHGVERVGAQLAWSFLKSTIDRLVWDNSHQELFQKVRLVIIPLVNPIGFKYFKRSNGNDVDLMRNSPIDAIEPAPFFVGGQRFSSHLPWYRGKLGVIEEENRVVLNKFLSATKFSRCVVSIDFHSGFGMKDRIWFPFSHTKKPFDFLPQMYSLTNLFADTHPYHIYKVEPQSHGYLINGDLWDHIFYEFRKLNSTSIYLPLTLEMGSWIWVKKNPLQIFSREGIFNPVKEHRLKRTFRRHNLILDFMLKALYSHNVWSNLSPDLISKYELEASKRWYDKK